MRLPAPEGPALPSKTLICITARPAETASGPCMGMPKRHRRS